MNFLENYENFMPHGHCFMWLPEILWMHVISDAIVVISYYALPIVLGYIALKIKIDEKYKNLFLLFSIFILACGTTHLINIVNIWEAKYLLAGVIKMITATVSLLTLVATIKILPDIMKLISDKNDNNPTRL